MFRLCSNQQQRYLQLFSHIILQDQEIRTQLVNFVGEKPQQSGIRSIRDCWNACMRIAKVCFPFPPVLNSASAAQKLNSLHNLWGWTCHPQNYRIAHVTTHVACQTCQLHCIIAYLANLSEFGCVNSHYRSISSSPREPQNLVPVSSRNMEGQARQLK